MNVGENNLKILLLGGSGLVGTAVRQVCSASGYEVVAPSHGQFDLCRTSHIEREVLGIAPGLIVNCAGLNGRLPCARHPELAQVLNAELPEILARCAERLGVGMVQISSSGVFDGNKAAPYDEQDTPAPVDVYGQTKYEGELSVARQCSRALIVRFPMLYGPRANSGSSFVEKMTRLLQAEAPLQVSYDEFNSPLFSFEGVRRMMDLVRQGRSGCFHVTSSGYESLFGIVEYMDGILGCRARIEPVSRGLFLGESVEPIQWALSSTLLVPGEPWQTGLGTWLFAEGKVLSRHA